MPWAASPELAWRCLARSQEPPGPRFGGPLSFFLSLRAGEGWGFVLTLWEASHFVLLDCPAGDFYNVFLKVVLTQEHFLDSGRCRRRSGAAGPFPAAEPSPQAFAVSRSLQPKAREVSCLTRNMLLLVLFLNLPMRFFTSGRGTGLF